jgi:polygalacturonase
VSSKNVIIRDSQIETGDDAIDLSTHVLGYPTQNVTVVRNRLSSTSSAQNIGMFVVDDISRVLFAHNIVTDTNRGIGILPRIGGGQVFDVLYQNISIETFFFSLPWWGSAEPVYICGGALSDQIVWNGSIHDIYFS